MGIFLPLKHLHLFWGVQGGHNHFLIYVDKLASLISPGYAAGVSQTMVLSCSTQISFPALPFLHFLGHFQFSWPDPPSSIHLATFCSLGGRGLHSYVFCYLCVERTTDVRWPSITRLWKKWQVCSEIMAHTCHPCGVCGQRSQQWNLNTIHLHKEIRM